MSYLPLRRTKKDVKPSGRTSMQPHRLRDPTSFIFPFISAFLQHGQLHSAHSEGPDFIFPIMVQEQGMEALTGPESICAVPVTKCLQNTLFHLIVGADSS